jgi:hypothetical protein
MQRLLERFDRVVHAIRRHIHLGRSAPHRDGTAAVVGSDETADVVAQLLDHFRFARAFLDVRSVQALDVLGIENAGHRPHAVQFVANEIEMFARQHISMNRRFIRVLGEDVPSAEDDVV